MSTDGNTADIDVTDAMVDAALTEYRASDLDGRALVRRMIEAALRERPIPPNPAHPEETP